MDIYDVLDELGVGTPPSVPPTCRTLNDKVIELTAEVVALEKELADLLRQVPVPPPVPPTTAYLDLLRKIEDRKKRILDKKDELKKATDALKACLAGALGPLCRELAKLLKGLTNALRFYQKEITGKVVGEPPRRKEVIMRDIRMCQFAIAWVKQLRRALGCPSLPQRIPRLTREMRVALEREGVLGPH
jgi:hypothetical protein